MKNFTHIQKKLLKKVDLFNYKSTNMPMENAVIGRFQLKSHDEYRGYNRVMSSISSLVAKIRQLPSDSKIRLQVTKEMLDYMFRLGVVDNKLSLESIYRLKTSDLCKRRLPVVIKKLGMMPHMDAAVKAVEHGRKLQVSFHRCSSDIKIGSNIVHDTATLVTRDMEDIITWADGSPYQKVIKEFRNERDDYNDQFC